MPSLEAGQQLGPYEVIAPIGSGGMGEVYRARDSRLGRDVAIKVLPGELSRDPERLARFEQEARAASQLSHPNILTVFDIGSHEGAPYIVLELLEGDTLRERMRGGELPPEVDPVNFAPHVKVPVLMVNGREDFDLPYATAQLPMFRMLGTPEADKRHVVFAGGHIPPRPEEAIKVLLDWLDDHLGAVR